MVKLVSTPPPATTGSHYSASTSTAGALHRSLDHGDAYLVRERASLHSPMPLLTNDHSPFRSPLSIPSLFAHGSQILLGIGQAHRSINFSQIVGKILALENPP